MILDLLIPAVIVLLKYPLKCGSTSSHAVPCSQLKAGGKFADLARLEASKWGIWYRGPQPHALARDMPLAQADVPLDANMDLSLVVTGVQPLPSAMANTILGHSANTAPSVAFQVSCSWCLA